MPPQCRDSQESLERAFSLLARLHHRPCTKDTPVVVHHFTHAGLGNAIGQLLLSLHFAALHERTLVLSPLTDWVWTNGTGFDATDLFWPSSCDVLARRSIGDAKAFTRAIRMRGIFCPSYGCTWANVLPSPVADLCMVTWFSHLTNFILRPSGRMMAWLQATAQPACSLRVPSMHAL